MIVKYKFKQLSKIDGLSFTIVMRIPSHLYGVVNFVHFKKDPIFVTTDLDL